ncbi:Asp-tRNA(Asn)/Glu-tRNA(Gln) amidotransferase subunit GatC, partial [Omnitrophica bacterium]|nr:Asp-tRNA(Asn)/Glu-tRNA(Gln) amidotransferase subunit GatC [Candidatus Omnitrophota bacterium]
SGQLGNIISYIEKLNKVDTKDTPPTTHSLPLMNVFREDEVRDSLSVDKVLMNAPRKAESSFKVPKVIEGE